MMMKMWNIRLIHRKKYVKEVNETLVLMSDVASDSDWNSQVKFWPIYFEFFKAGIDVVFKLFPIRENASGSNPKIQFTPIYSEFKKFGEYFINFSLRGRLHNGEMIVVISHKPLKSQGLVFKESKAPTEDIFTKMRELIRIRMYLGNNIRNSLLSFGMHTMGFARRKSVQDRFKNVADYVPKLDKNKVMLETSDDRLDGLLAARKKMQLTNIGEAQTIDAVSKPKSKLLPSAPSNQIRPQVKVNVTSKSIKPEDERNVYKKKLTKLEEYHGYERTVRTNLDSCVPPTSLRDLGTVILSDGKQIHFNYNDYYASGYDIAHKMQTMEFYGQEDIEADLDKCNELRRDRDLVEFSMEFMMGNTFVSKSNTTMRTADETNIDDGSDDDEGVTTQLEGIGTLDNDGDERRNSE